LADRFRPSARHVQFRTDTEVLYRLVVYYRLVAGKSDAFRQEWIASRGHVERHGRLERGLLEELEETLRAGSPPTETKLGRVQQHVNRQVVDLLRSIDHGPAEDTVEKSTPSFSLRERPSRIEQSGLGVFMKGQAAPGTVVAFYPGILVTPSRRDRVAESARG
jgi:hypothetical protein